MFAKINIDTHDIKAILVSYAAYFTINGSLLRKKINKTRRRNSDFSRHFPYFHLSARVGGGEWDRGIFGKFAHFLQPTHRFMYSAYDPVLLSCYENINKLINKKVHSTSPLLLSPSTSPPPTHTHTLLPYPSPPPPHQRSHALSQSCYTVMCLYKQEHGYPLDFHVQRTQTGSRMRAFTQQGTSL